MKGINRRPAQTPAFLDEMAPFKMPDYEKLQRSKFMSELNEDVKTQLKTLIDASDIDGLFDLLLTNKQISNPHLMLIDTSEVLPLELTASQRRYLQEKVKMAKSGDEATWASYIIDGVMKADPSTRLGKGLRK